MSGSCPTETQTQSRAITPKGQGLLHNFKGKSVLPILWIRGVCIQDVLFAVGTVCRLKSDFKVKWSSSSKILF